MRKRLIALSIMFITAAAVLSGTAFYQMQTTEKDIELAPLAPGKNTAVYAAYSADGTVPDYVVSYLKKLKKIAPNIVYVTDNPIRCRDIAKLAPYVNQLIARRHGEYDWGSYKRGYNWLRQHNALNKSQILILANDSTLLAAPSLKPVVEAAEGSGADIFGITANTDGIYHLQSYFLIIAPQVYAAPEFAAWLNAVKPEKDGLTVAYRYEVPFTNYLQNLGFTADTFIPDEDVAYLPLNDKNCYPLTLLSQHHSPFLKMRAFTERLNVQEPRRLLFSWLKQHHPSAYKDLIRHLQKIQSPYLKEAR